MAGLPEPYRKDIKRQCIYWAETMRTWRLNKNASEYQRAKGELLRRMNALVLNSDAPLAPEDNS